MSKALIMGFATNQTRDSLEVFLNSARRLYKQEECDIALITNSTDGIQDILEATGTLVVNTPSTYSSGVSRYTKAYIRLFLHSARLLLRSGLLSRSPEIAAGYYQMIETWHHPHFARWMAYMRVMQTMHRYEKILLADTKDVVFQKDIFESIDANTVSIFEDGERFTPQGWNGRWYIGAFGRRNYDRVAHRQPICIGVVAGGAQPLLRFVEELCAAIAAKPFGRIEQAVFNKMYFNEEFSVDFDTFPNVSGPVLTMCGAGLNQATHCRDGLIYDTAGGRVVPVAHMYDRWSGVREEVQARYSSVPAVTA